MRGTRRSRRGGLGVVHRPVAQHGAGDVQEAVGDGTQRAGVTVAAPAQGVVAGLAHRIVLRRDAGPVVGGVAQPVVGGQAPGHDPAPAGTAG